MKACEMKVIKDCCDAVGASECIFGAHLFEKSVAKIYVAKGLGVGVEMGRSLFQSDEDGFAGHCLLVFYGVRSFDFSVSSYERQNGQLIWHEPVVFHCEGGSSDVLKKNKNKEYLLGGGLMGFRAYVAVSIKAEEFGIRVLDQN
jgi:hypothetical protein